MKPKESPHGGELDKSAAPVKPMGCEAWQKAYCIQTRAETDPESLMTGEPGVLACPICGVVINWGASE